MAKATYKFELDSSEIAPLIALCKEQAELISDLHEEGKSSELDKRVADIFEAISDMKLDVPLRKIKGEAVREAFKKAEIPAGAKSGCIGEFSIYVENGGVCPNCYGGSCDEDGDAECEVCYGESDGGLLDVSYDIPWTTQKEIFKAFCKYAEIEAGRKLERGEL